MAAAPQDYRYAVWQVLIHFKPQAQNCTSLIEKYSAGIENRPAVIDISLGVIRNLIVIDHLITKISGREKKEISAKILNCLRIAVYELIFSDGQDYAIVNEAVNLASKTGSKKAAGFVNAVLRNICRTMVNKKADLKTANPQKILPLNTKTGCEFNINIFEDTKERRIEYLSTAFSMPIWFVEKLLAQFGYEKTINICLASNRKPSIYARANKLKTNSNSLCQILQSENINCQIVEQFNMVKINKPGNITKLKSFQQGLFTIQDITASHAAILLEPQPKWKIFDLCAAPGTKTTQIAELCNDKCQIIATDKNSQRLIRVNENTKRLGINSVKTVDYNTFIKNSDPADAILVDAPCSNTGVLAKRCEARYRLNKKNTESLQKIQVKLLQQAAERIKNNGKICYSTCSILNEENSRLVNDFIKENPKFTLQKENLILPTAETLDHDGGYAAILIKTKI